VIPLIVVFLIGVALGVLATAVPTVMEVHRAARRLTAAEHSGGSSPLANHPASRASRHRRKEIP
jgi:hypothetical protein